MKIVLIFITLFTLSILFLVTVDLISGLPLSEALEILKHSFTVLTYTETLLIVISLFVPLYTPLTSFMKQRKKTKSGDDGNLKDPIS